MYHPSPTLTPSKQSRKATENKLESMRQRNQLLLNLKDECEQRLLAVMKDGGQKRELLKKMIKQVGVFRCFYS